MNFSEQIPEEEPKDRTRWIWLGMAALFLLAVFAVWITSRGDPHVSRVHARHILIKYDRIDPADRARALELVNQLRERIMKGESFRRLAREFSNDPYSSPRGGDLGYQRRGVFEPAFEEYVWSAPVNQLSEVVQTSYGFHLIVVTDRHISAPDLYEMELERKAVEAQRSPTDETEEPE